MKRYASKVMTLILLAIFAFVPLAFAEQEWLPGYGDKNGTLGKKGQSWRVVWGNTVYFEGLTSDQFAALLKAVDPTANNILWLPDISGILITNSGGEDMFNTTLIDGILNGVTEVEGELDINNGFINDVGYINFNLDDGIPPAEGRMRWNDTDGGADIGMKGGVVNLQVGQEQLVRGKNETGGAILNGTPVRISGVTGNFFLWGLSNAADPATAGSIGIATENIGNNQFGYITTFGLVRELDTTGTPVGEVWSSGDRIWVGSVSGELTNVAPTGSERKIFIGIICSANVNEGLLWVNPVNQAYFNELSGPLLTDGSVVFINSSGMTVEDNSNLTWDDTNDELIVSNMANESEMFISEVTIALDAGGAWANITGMSNGLVSANGMIQNGTDGSITVLNPGRYKSVLGASIENNDGPSEEYHMSMAVNGVEVSKCEQHRSISNQAALGAITVPCMFDLSANDVVTALANSIGGDDLTFEHLHWLLFK